MCVLFSSAEVQEPVAEVSVVVPGDWLCCRFGSIAYTIPALEYKNRKDASSESVVGILTDLPKDTDVLLVFQRVPRVPEFIGAGGYVFEIDVTGKIKIAGSLKEPLIKSTF